MRTESVNSALSGASEKTIDYSKRLPDTELDVMMIIWDTIPPVNTAYLMAKIGRARKWKAPTLISFLVRLEERGYLVSEKRGKERYYTPVADKNKYLGMMTDRFVEQYHNGSFLNLMQSYYAVNDLDNETLADLAGWLIEKGKK